MKQINAKASKNWVTISVTLLLSACASTANQAPVVERSHDVIKEVPVVTPETPAAKTVVDNRPTYTVKRGDTLLRIAFELGLNYRDIVAWNNLSNPNDIKVDQVLYVGPPDAQGVAKATPITSTANIEVRNLTPINPSTNKTSPRGDKRAYSEATLAEMQKSEQNAVASTGNNTVAKAEVAAVKPVEKAPEKSAIESIEWAWPTEGKIVASFDDVRVKGVQIAGKSGQDIYASAPGKVIYEGNAMRGYGNIVIIKHANNYLTAYAFNKTNVVREGQPVSKGQKIAEMGNTDTDSVKLHFEIRQAGKPVDPMKLLPAR
ncbi:MAG: LysM peptidoglycan-binding domain-containing protein [Burkholderiaceae bacterium]|nr:MAG: LysM peptidoglycan-binding domain-containing protein [Burkholderiaceae bacterium]